jgi:uracil-DNA glycosylase
VDRRSASERREDLVALYKEVQACTRCPLFESRTQPVFGMGNADAELMFVGEAPGFHEDQQGKPFVGRAGQLLDKLLQEIGLERADVFITNVLKSRPPGNRDPLPDEIGQCKPYLYRQIELIEPKVICTLGNFATKLLSGSPQGITRVHGRPQEHEIGGQQVRLYPLFHPAAALRTPAVLQELRGDMERLPALIEEVQAEQRGPGGPEPALAGGAPAGAAAGTPAAAAPEPSQLGLFGG